MSQLKTMQDKICHDGMELADTMTPGLSQAWRQAEHALLLTWSLDRCADSGRKAGAEWLPPMDFSSLDGIAHFTGYYLCAVAPASNAR